MSLKEGMGLKMSYQYTVRDIYQLNREIQKHQLNIINPLHNDEETNSIGWDLLYQQNIQKIHALKERQSHLLVGLASKWLPFYLSEAYKAWQTHFSEYHLCETEEKIEKRYQTAKFEKHYFQLLKEYLIREKELNKEVKEFLKLSMLQHVSYKDYLALKPVETDDTLLSDQLSYVIELCKVSDQEIKRVAMDMIEVYEFNPANLQSAIRGLFNELAALEQSKIQVMVTDLYAQMPTVGYRALFRAYGKIFSLGVSLYHHCMLMQHSELFQQSDQTQPIIIDHCLNQMDELDFELETLRRFLEVEQMIFEKNCQADQLYLQLKDLFAFLESDPFEECTRQYLLSHSDLPYFTKRELVRYLLGKTDLIEKVSTRSPSKSNLKRKLYKLSDIVVS